MATRRDRPKLSDIPEDVDSHQVMLAVEQLRWDVKPTIELGVQVRGLVAIVGWLALVATILLAVIAASLVTGASIP